MVVKILVESEMNTYTRGYLTLALHNQGLMSAFIIGVNAFFYATWMMVSLFILTQGR